MVFATLVLVWATLLLRKTTEDVGTSSWKPRLIAYATGTQMVNGKQFYVPKLVNVGQGAALDVCVEFPKKNGGTFGKDFALVKPGEEIDFDPIAMPKNPKVKVKCVDGLDRQYSWEIEMKQTFTKDLHGVLIG